LRHNIVPVGRYSKESTFARPVLDPLPTLHHIDILVSEYPTTPALVGDYNNDGKVDASDYVTWRRQLGAATITNRDPNNAGVIGQSDYNAWRAHFGQTSSSGTSFSANAAVPEPTALRLLMLAATGWCLRRGRAHRNSRELVNA
jgi:hypothetical protein